MSNLATDNSASVQTDNPIQEPVPSVVETGSTGGQVTGETPADDLFRGVDPNRLPPEMKAYYDSMLRDYREKTSKLSETIKSEAAKATEAYRSKAELYDQIATQEEFVRQWNEYVQKSQAQGQNTPQAGDPVLTQMKAQLEEMNQKIQLSELSQVAEAFAEAVNEKGEKLHPEFDQLNEIFIGQLQENGRAEPFSLLRASIELASGSPQEKLANGYKMAKAVYDSIFEMGKKAGMGRVQAKIANSTQPASHSLGDTLSITDKKPKSAREALEMARKGVMVSRD